MEPKNPMPMQSVLYGGDYNPEQWPEAVWDEDMDLMREAGVNFVTLGVFAWSRLEPEEGRFDFAWLDRIVAKLHAAGVRIDLATATASPPPWLTHRYPETLPVTKDGVRLGPGSRQHICPSSPVHRRFAARLVTALAERYGDHPALAMWHVGNEFGCHVSHCYCDVSAAAFRTWLIERYADIDAINAAWATNFWSQRYSSIDEVYPPSAMPTFANPGQQLDFDRFSSDELMADYRVEADILRERTPDVPITTNFMGFFKPADYWAWSELVDVIADDLYPDPHDPTSPARAAMQRDLVRSLGGGRPWILMEQATSAVNWRLRNGAKRVGQYRAWSYQAIARGADGILQFQWRQSAAGAERFHSGMVPHAGTHSRVWRDVVGLGEELAALGRVVGTEVAARVAIVFDWTTWWSLDQQALPAQVDYVETVFSWYRELYRRNIAVDFVPLGASLSDYDAVLAPTLFAASREHLSALADYVHRGGHLLVTYLTGIVDPIGHVYVGEYLGPLAATLGVRVEEFAPLAADEAMPLRGAQSEIGAAHSWSEFATAVDAQVVWFFDHGDLTGHPAVTSATRGTGRAWYVATQPAPATLSTILGTFLAEAGVHTDEHAIVADVEIVRRGDLTFVISHRDESVVVRVAGRDVRSGALVDEVTVVGHGVVIIEHAPVTA